MQLLILLTDVDGVYNKPPKAPGAQRLSVYCRDSSCVMGAKSTQGRGGMQAKIEAACNAVDGGVNVSKYTTPGWMDGCID